VCLLVCASAGALPSCYFSPLNVCGRLQAQRLGAEAGAEGQELVKGLHSDMPRFHSLLLDMGAKLGDLRRLHMWLAAAELPGLRARGCRSSGSACTAASPALRAAPSSGEGRATQGSPAGGAAGDCGRSVRLPTLRAWGPREAPPQPAEEDISGKTDAPLVRSRGCSHGSQSASRSSRYAPGNTPVRRSFLGSIPGLASELPVGCLQTGESVGHVGGPRPPRLCWQRLHQEAGRVSAPFRALLLLQGRRQQRPCSVGAQGGPLAPCPGEACLPLPCAIPEHTRGSDCRIQLMFGDSFHAPRLRLWEPQPLQYPQQYSVHLSTCRVLEYLPSDFSPLLFHKGCLFGVEWLFGREAPTLGACLLHLLSPGLPGAHQLWRICLREALLEGARRIHVSLRRLWGMLWWAFAYGSVLVDSQVWPTSK